MQRDLLKPARDGEEERINLVETMRKDREKDKTKQIQRF